MQTFPEISGFAHFHEFFTFASCVEDVFPTDPWVPGSQRAKAVWWKDVPLSFPTPLSFFGSHQILHNLFNSSPEVKDRNSCQLCGAQWSVVSMQSLHLPPGSGFLIGMAVSRDNASRADAELQTTEGWKGKRKVCLLQPALKRGAEKNDPNSIQLNFLIKLRTHTFSPSRIPFLHTRTRSFTHTRSFTRAPRCFWSGVLPWSSSLQFLVGCIVTKREEPG